MNLKIMSKSELDEKDYYSLPRRFKNLKKNSFLKGKDNRKK